MSSRQGRETGLVDTVLAQVDDDGGGVDADAEALGEAGRRPAGA